MHDKTDSSVEYRGDSVWVDGVDVTVLIYGQKICAAQCFKYLGIWLDAQGECRGHLDSRHDATQRAGNQLLAGLLRIPAASHSFVL